MEWLLAEAGDGLWTWKWVRLRSSAAATPEVDATTDTHIERWLVTVAGNGWHHARRMSQSRAFLAGFCRVVSI